MDTQQFPEAAQEETTIKLPGDIPLVMVRIPAGTFMMGRYPDEQDSSDCEEPQHEATISRDFWLGKYTVTKGQWKAVMGPELEDGSEAITALDENCPIYSVSWNDTQRFIDALNEHIKKTKQGTVLVRLPSEAEWEYAARAGTTTRFYWGDDPDYKDINYYAWWDGNAYGGSESDVRIVGLKMPNDFGLYDMSGNVWEWCEDWFAEYPAGPVTDPVGPESGAHRVLRGGGWTNEGRQCRSAYRSYALPPDATKRIGFRLAM